MLSFFPRGVLDEILNFIESVSEGFPSYSYILFLSFSLPKIYLIYALLTCGSYRQVLPLRKSDTFVLLYLISSFFIFPGVILIYGRLT